MPLTWSRRGRVAILSHSALAARLGTVVVHPRVLHGERAATIPVHRPPVAVRRAVGVSTCCKDALIMVSVGATI